LEEAEHLWMDTIVGKETKFEKGAKTHNGMDRNKKAKRVKKIKQTKVPPPLISGIKEEERNTDPIKLNLFLPNSKPNIIKRRMKWKTVMCAVSARSKRQVKKCCYSNKP
jgi:hypothetical protein